ncbi:H/ACA ribonucleoprotein complex subunit 2 isoform X1 [Phocoena sinus]|uniref:H/ACA ribonucleoprotein complex subunit 2 isoform X1 n=1 Tax=Phocoena sinus TaxID=42100 RepID=UPI0013C4744A|nr:H/ACA ribonucleoprotein complex subunit 2 isoform X1 [Phocoena sinus]
MTKIKADPDGPEAQADACCGERTYHELLVNLNPIAQPLASRRLTRKLYKCIKKAVKQKQIRRGVKEVQKFINKGEKGIMVLAGDTLPIEVYCHLPVMCEDRNLPYVYIPSKTVRSTCARSWSAQEGGCLGSGMWQQAIVGRSMSFGVKTRLDGFLALLLPRRGTARKLPLCTSISFL